jgi:hypothetical protein
MPRFVILEHDHPVLHWDLMLEADGILRTWRLAQSPLPSSGVIEATPLSDHRLMYLDYEGPVGGDRGTVKRWDVGDYEMLAESTQASMILEMKGNRLQARVLLKPNTEDSQRSSWGFSIIDPLPLTPTLRP